MLRAIGQLASHPFSGFAIFFFLTQGLYIAAAPLITMIDDTNSLYVDDWGSSNPIHEQCLRSIRYQM